MSKIDEAKETVLAAIAPDTSREEYLNLATAYQCLLNAEYTQVQIDREREGDKNKGKRPLDERIEPNLPESMRAQSN